MRVIVTGGAGYIGAVTVRRLLEDDHDVVVLDDLRRDHGDRVPDAAELVEADVGEPGSYADALDGADACIHFAARIEAGESMQRPAAFYRDNTAATLRLVAALVDAGIARLVFSSTAAVYGDPPRVPIDEDAPTEPTNVYGHTKLAVEEALGWLARLGALRSASLRYFNAAGAVEGLGEDHDPETHLIPLVLEAAAGRRDEVAIFGSDYDTPDGTCVRDYIHVADLADAHVLALHALGERERLVANLGNGAGYSVREVVESARRVTGREIPVREAARRPGDPARLVASADRARETLGWRPRRPDLDDIVASAWSWHRARWEPDVG